MTAPHLSTSEKAQIVTLAADGQAPARIAKQVGRSNHTVTKFLQEPEIKRQVEDEKAVLADLYRAKARKVVESISDSDIGKASLQQKSISSGVLLDKSLLLSGDAPTVRVEVLLAAVQAVRDMRTAENEQRRQLSAPAPEE